MVHLWFEAGNWYFQAGHSSDERWFSVGLTTASGPVLARRQCVSSWATNVPAHEVALVRNCRACRLDRCILVGMSADAVKLPSNMDAAALRKAVSNRRKELIEGSTKSFKVIRRVHTSSTNAV